MKKLGIIMTHPIQYNAPWIRMLAERGKIGVKVFYTWFKDEKEEKFDKGFNKNISWDIPLLAGYEFEFVENISSKREKGGFLSVSNPMLVKRVEEFDPDAVLVSGWNYKSHLSLMRYFHQKIPVLFRGDSTLLDDTGIIKSNIRKGFLKKVYKYIDFALYTGTENKRYFERNGITGDRLIFAPHAVDNRRFSPNDNTLKIANTIKNDLGIDESDVIFLFAGKFQIKKDVALLINVFKKTGLKKVHLILVGNGPLEHELRSLANGRKQIHFMDFQNQQIMPAIYQLCDVFVLPSKGPGETWGLAVNEAMASGKPVLVSDKCGCATDLVTKGKTGFVFKSGNQNDLEEKMKLLAEDKSKCEEMGKNALQKIRDWSFERVVEAIENIVINRC